MSLLPHLDEKVRERFAAKVDTGAGLNRCHPWTAGKTKGGYGTFSLKPLGTVYAHHVAWTIHHRVELGVGEEIHHSCENRACVNPTHLHAVTHAENMAHVAGPRTEPLTLSDYMARYQVQVSGWEIERLRRRWGRFEAYMASLPEDLSEAESGYVALVFEREVDACASARPEYRCLPEGFPYRPGMESHPYRPWLMARDADTIDDELARYVQEHREAILRVRWVRDACSTWTRNLEPTAKPHAERAKAWALRRAPHRIDDDKADPGYVFPSMNMGGDGIIARLRSVWSRWTTRE